MKTYLTYKVECDLAECRTKFYTDKRHKRFCCAAHKNLWHARERYRIVKLHKLMGVKT